LFNIDNLFLPRCFGLKDPIKDIKDPIKDIKDQIKDPIEDKKINIKNPIKSLYKIKFLLW